MSQRKPPRGRSRPGSAERRKTPAERPRKSALRRPGPGSGAAPIWLYGAHVVREALANPRRRCRRLLLGDDAARRHGAELRARLAQRPPGEAPPLQTAPRERIAEVLPDGAVHHGFALLAEPLAQPALRDLLAGPPALGAADARAVIVVLDQVTDPQNVGAVLRSAAAFGARAVITTERHAPAESGALAKAASGALEHLAYVRETNLVRVLQALKGTGFWCLGLSGDAERDLAAADPGGPLALVLGAEGRGLRRLTRAACDILARLPTRPPIDTLNVANAAAVALYEVLGRERGRDAP